MNIHKDLRKYILANFLEIKEVYEYGVNPRDCAKPCVIVQTMKDVDYQKAAGYTRIINMYVLMDRTSFCKLDDLCMRIKQSIDKKTIGEENPFTPIFSGFIKSDNVDEEYNLIFKTITFNILSLYKTIGEEVDPWLIAIGDYIKTVLPDYNIYYDSFQPGFKVPCIMLRIKDIKQKRLNYALKTRKITVACHVVDNEERSIFNSLDAIVDSIVKQFKIPLSIEDKTFLTLDDLADSPCLDVNRYDDAFIKGQLTIRFSQIVNDRDKKTKLTSVGGRHFYYYKQ